MRINRTDNKQMLEMVDQSIDGLDEQRAQSLQRLQTVQEGRNQAQKRERNRLEQKYGSDHPRVQKLTSRMQYNQGAARELQTEVGNAGITIPDYDSNTWMVHGRVLEAQNGRPVKGVSVSLYTAKGEWVQALGYSCTDEQGYYSLRYSREVPESDKMQTTMQRGATGMEASSESLTINTNIDTNRKELYLTVTDSDHNIIHTESDPVVIQPGRIDYRLIILEKGQCTPPVNDSRQSKEVFRQAGSRRWSVAGTVSYDDKTPAAGVTVSLYDKEHIYDEVLGTVKTDSNGEFSLAYSQAEMKALFAEQPELYFKVLDEQGEQLFSSRKTLKVAEQDRQELNITVKKR